MVLVRACRKAVFDIMSKPGAFFLGRTLIIIHILEGYNEFIVSRWG